MSFTHELPEVPVLPPLGISLQEKSTPDMALTKPVSRGNEAPKVAPSPSPSFADSFATAYTSPVDENDEISRLGPSSLAPPQSLRKSISVDSFAKYGRDGARSNRKNGTASPDSPRSPVYGSPVESAVRPDRKPWSGRIRGESLSLMQRDHCIPPALDSDGDRYDPLTSIERFRRVSLKNPDPLRSAIRGGDLPLPSRSQTSSMSGTPTNTTPREGLSQVPSSSSLASSSKRPFNFAVANPGRSRSGSLGYAPPSAPKRMVINTHIAPPVSRMYLQKNKVMLMFWNSAGCLFPPRTLSLLSLERLIAGNLRSFVKGSRHLD